MRYCPLVPRLLLAYQNPELARLYKWHATNKLDGSLRGPIEGEAWSHIEEKFPNKFEDPRAVRLALAMDGMCPFGSSGHSGPYSILPVFLTTYNLPPWLATKSGYCWLSMILPGN